MEELVEKLAQLEKLYDEYEHKIYIDKINIVEPDLSIDRQTMLAMSYQDLQGLIWDYSKYILFLQKTLNKHISRYNWAETNLKRYCERESANYEGFKWEERQSNALTYSEYAQRLFNLKTKSKFAIDRLSFLPTKIQTIIDIARDVAYSKRRYENAQSGN